MTWVLTPGLTSAQSCCLELALAAACLERYCLGPKPWPYTVNSHKVWSQLAPAVADLERCCFLSAACAADFVAAGGSSVLVQHLRACGRGSRNEVHSRVLLNPRLRPQQDCVFGTTSAQTVLYNPKRVCMSYDPADGHCNP